VGKGRAVLDESALILQSRALPLFLKRARRLGLAISDLETKYGLAPSAAEESEVAIGLVAFRAIAEELALRAKDTLFGLHVAIDAARGHYGVIEYVVRNSPDVRAIIDHVVRFGRNINAQMRLTFDAETGRVMQTIPGAPDVLGRQGNEYALAYQLKVSREAAGQAFAPTRVHFAHARDDDDDDELVTFLGTRDIVYRAGFNGMDFSREVLALPITSADPALLGVLAQRAREKAEELDDVSDFDLLGRAIADALASGDVSGPHLAKRLGVSPRTLQRRLEAGRTTLRQVVDGVRLRLALSYLEDAERSIGDVALLLGYSDARAFSRAFMRWTGKTPLAHRQERSRKD
jgi:AraC-like DNA-binding protein